MNDIEGGFLYVLGSLGLGFPMVAWLWWFWIWSMVGFSSTFLVVDY